MPQSQRPKGLQLRKALRTKDYGQDVGYMHRGDYAWHQAGLDCMIYGTGMVLTSGLEAQRIPPQSIGRYLDGEEEREGLYR